ncbi:MAG: 4Fe-4S binding protein [Mogibacterium sp.]|nr:4Fe-4S binding protein [Mogibacterium sp.]
MADLRTNFLGFELKNPVGVSSCDFGGEVAYAKRVIDQGIGWLTSKTVHDIDGPHHWPRPYFYSLKQFGPDMRDAWVCSQMFHNMPYEQFLEDEGPKLVKLCHDNGVMFIGSVATAGESPEKWARVCRDMESIGVDAIELDTGGPHATFGATVEEADCGAPQAMDPVKAYACGKAAVDAVKVPVIFKCTPQCVDQAIVSKAIARSGCAGITANNAFYGTWIDHETGTFYGGPYAVGGLMGRPWQIFSLAKMLETTATLKGYPVMGVGGIFTWDDCVRYLMAGASVVGLCSAVYSRGVGVLKDCIEGMDAFMDRKGYKSIADFQGCVVDQFGYVRDWPKENWMSHKSPILPHFDLENCTKCGICEKLCPYGAIKTGEDKAPYVDPDVCNGCGWCMGHCPSKQQVIKMYDEETGDCVWDGRGTHKAWAKRLPDHAGL